MRRSPPEMLMSTNKFDVVRYSHPLPDGTLHTREIIRHRGAVLLVPQLDDGRLCLIRNYRISVDRWLVEFPAGTIDPGESPATTAARELTEETGYTAGRLEPLVEFYMSPGILDERMYVFLATQLTAGQADLQAGEQIEPLLASLEEALAMCVDGRIEDAKTMAALLSLKQRRERAT